jgi:hypothetical protein
MTEVRIRDIENEKARRRAAGEMITRYHEEQLRLLLDHVRDGLAKLDAGEIDAFDLDDLIHHYKRAAQKLWSFCGSTGGAREHAALLLEWERAGRARDGLVGGRSSAPPRRLTPPRSTGQRGTTRPRATISSLLRDRVSQRG